MNNYELEEGQIVLCTVDKILGTVVFVKIQDNIEGTITTSEISPGRIRNLRDYVIPGKKIVCKILKIQGDKIYLSLRRVKQNEKKELLDKLAKENSYKAILKTVLGKEESEDLIKKITNKKTIFDFFEEIKTKPEVLKEKKRKENKEKILSILDSKKEKPKEIKKKIKLSNNSSTGIKQVKNIFEEVCKDSKCKVSYLAAGKYSLSIKGDNFKEIKTEINKTIDSIEKQAKKTHSEFSVEKA